MNITVFPDHSRKDGTISQHVQCWSWSIIGTTGKVIASSGGLSTKRQAIEQANRVSLRLSAN
jgi:hypothetical protein